MTVVPQHAVDALRLQLVTEDLELHTGTGDVTTDARLYRADIQIEGLPVQTVGITTTKGALAYIGLDLLLDYVATFNGPQQNFTLD